MTHSLIVELLSVSPILNCLFLYISSNAGRYSTHTFKSLSQLSKKFAYIHIYFFSLYFFGEPAAHFRNFFICCPSQRSARSQVPSLGGNPPGDSQSAVGWEHAGFEPGTAGQQPGALLLSYHATPTYT
jgi:hypothetical protein